MVIVVLAVDNEDFFNGDAAALQQADLLGFLVLDGSAAAQRIEMIFAEIFLLELRGGSFCSHFPSHHVGSHPALTSNTVQFAGDELEARVVESSATVVDNSDPAVEVGILIIARDGENVVCVPG